VSKDYLVYTNIAIVRSGDTDYIQDPPIDVVDLRALVSSKNKTEGLTLCHDKEIKAIGDVVKELHAENQGLRKAGKKLSVDVDNLLQERGQLQSKLNEAIKQRDYLLHSVHMYTKTPRTLIEDLEILNKQLEDTK
jgi:molybdopterin converting factor small subunit